MRQIANDAASRTQPDTALIHPSQPHNEYSTHVVLPQNDWRHSLRLRPLLPLAALVGAGCALGLARPSLLAAAAHSQAPPPPALQVTALFVLVITLLLWKRRTFPVAAVAVACSVLFVLCAVMAAQRTLPPRDDISQLVRAQPSRAVPQQRLPVTLSGTVANHPQSSDFGIEFPLQCRSLQTVATASTRSAVTRLVNGRVWVSLPPQFSPAAPLQVGDELTLRADLADLTRTGNSGERSRQARYIMARCWGIARVRKAEDAHIIQRGTDASLEGTIARLRAGLMAHYQAAFTAPGAMHVYPHARAQLLVAMVFGEGGLQQSLPRLTRDQFRAAGLSHLLVASGAQVSETVISRWWRSATTFTA